MSDFRSALRTHKHIFFDGGMGTMLQGRGLPAGMSPELFCLENPDILSGIHLEYAQNGADVLTTNSFGGTRSKLPQGLDVVDFNIKMAEAAKKAAAQAGRHVWVAGSVGPTGQFVKPLGALDFSDMVELFREQIRGLVAGGVDIILAETHFDIAELRAVILAARAECNLPVGASMTFEGGVSLTGTSPAVFAHTMMNMGVDFIATNCSAGPEQMRDVVQVLLEEATIPVLVMPNAGLPELDNGKTVFRLQPEEFARHTAIFARMGVRCLGGCCGTTPDHIAALRRRIEAEAGENLEDIRVAPKPESGIVLTSRSAMLRIAPNAPFQVIGERINPTGKKVLSAEFQAGELGAALQFAREQVAAGVRILDVNVGAPMVDETVLLPALIARLAAAHNEPLSLDSSNADAVEAALNVYPASPLVNSISGEPGRMERLGPICRDYGAPFILLPLKGRKLPVLASERIAIIDELLAQAGALRIPRRLIMVDVLALAVSSKPEAALHCFETIRYCNSLGLATTIGLSNISFGLPARPLLNGTFLAMSVAHGLSSCIANRGETRLREAIASAELFMGRDSNASAFIGEFSGWQSGSGAASVNSANSVGITSSASEQSAKAEVRDALEMLRDAVILGERDNVASLVKDSLATGKEPYSIVHETLIPAITVVGEKYERKEYYLPQLLRAAETMQDAFALLKPLLEQSGTAEVRPVVIMATVEGDIHDIGKNIVSLMLGNHGFDVIDLGKDVKAEAIVDAAVAHGAKLIGLSALMTTTMVRMEDCVRLVRERGLDIRIMIGGAVVTPAFAKAIGADGYADDAVGAVREAQRLLQ